MAAAVVVAVVAVVVVAMAVASGIEGPGVVVRVGAVFRLRTSRVQLRVAAI